MPYSSCCVVGLGYIGLPTAALLASRGFEVKGIDINSDVVQIINSGNVHIVEPGLSELVASVVASGSLVAYTNPQPSDVFIIAVPTPFKDDSNLIPEPNIDYVLQAAESVSDVLEPGNLVLIESTSPVGTTEYVAQVIAEKSSLPLEQFDIAYCPERVLPGKILDELVTNDRVIGGLTPASSLAGKEFYSRFCHGSLLSTNSRTAELVKLAENSFRDVNIAFANEISIVCDQLDVNVRDMINLANHHPRVNILNPGCGVGGHCIAVDPWFIASASPESTPLIQTARSVNDSKAEWVVDQVVLKAKTLEQELGRPPRIGCMGISFKPDVDDLRESPALYITKKLLSHGHNILICEPNLVSHSVFTLSTIESTVENSDLLVFLVAHSRFIGLDLAGVQVFDLCGVLEKAS